nr:asialoglycoprotein receptor 1-like [Labrus bergylta]XP_029138519.1 asialoglycoprotein receptor 1-like [Labrus bergylta]
MQQMEIDYINERPRAHQKHSVDVNQTERRLCRLLLLSFAVLCIIQASLNISLRLTVNSNRESHDCNTTQTKSYDQFNRLQERFNALTRDKNLLENRNNELNNLIKEMQEEQDRLKIQLREMGGCPSYSQCPAGWRQIGSRCYLLSSDSKTWEDSRKYCQSKAADLVVINSEQEQRDLYQLDGDVDLLFWIGLYDTAGTFRWVDGSMLSKPFWQSGQPDRGGPNNREDCVEMNHNNPVLANWNDARCGDKRRWLCEKSPSTC